MNLNDRMGMVSLVRYVEWELPESILSFTSSVCWNGTNAVKLTSINNNNVIFALDLNFFNMVHLFS